MKRTNIYLSTTLAILLAGTAMAQTTAIDRYYQKYNDDERFTKVFISSKMFGLFTEFETDDKAQKAMGEAISKLKGLKMLVGEQIDNAPALYKELVKGPQANMEELMTIQKEGAEFKFFITESGGKISELLMLIFDKNHLLMMSIVGEINLSDMAKLSKHMNITGFEHLENVGNKSSK